MTTKRKPVLPALSTAVAYSASSIDTAAAHAELRAAERIIRAARRYIAQHPDGYGLRRAVTNLDKLTRRTP